MSMTIAGMREKLQELGGNVKEFNQAKSKDLKQGVLLHVFFSKIVQAKVVSSAPASAPSGQDPKASGSSVKSGGDGKTSTSSKFEDAKNFKPDISPGILSELPENLAKILVFEEVWLEKILNGTKTLELRKTLIGDDWMYLAFKDTIVGKCFISHPIEISNLDEYESLKEAHQCPVPPYSFPMVGHRVSQCQRLEPLKFKKLRGAVGRALYRPVDELPEKGTGDQKDEIQIPEDTETKDKSNTKCKKTKKEGTATKKTTETKKNSKQVEKKTGKGIKASQADLLQGQVVQVLNHKELCR